MNRKLHDRFWTRLHHLNGATGRNNNALFHRLFRDICLQTHPELVIEIGAFEAAFSKGLASTLDGAELLAYEANPHVFARFAPTMPPGVTYLNKAVGAVEGQLPFHVINAVTGPQGQVSIDGVNRISSLRERQGDAMRSEIVQCECTTVDRIVSDHGSPRRVALWIDAEGAVGDILRGAPKALAENVVAIMTEMETCAEWTGQWLAGDIRDHLAGFGFVPVVRDCETDWQFNEILVRESAITDGLLDVVDGYIEQLIAAGRTLASK